MNYRKIFKYKRKKVTNKHTLELLYYFIFINNLIPKITLYKLNLLNNVLIYFIKNKNFCKKNLFNMTIKNEYFKIKTNLNKFNYALNNAETPIFININKTNVKNNSLLYFFKKFFNFFFSFSTHFFNKNYVFNSNYKLLYTYQINKHIYVNANKHFIYWMNAFLFIYNIFYYNINFLMFSSKIFKKETLSFNWINYNFSIDMWLKTFLFFTLKTNKFDIKTNFFYKNLKQYRIGTLIISDCLYHFKNLHYFNKYKFFLIGLVTTRINPWLVSYPIPIFINSYFSQFFFFRILFISYNYANKTKYNFYKQLWFWYTNMNILR
uniref:Ribosomal protein S2 n=1 Tax=Pseudourostyla cristata TaxID=293816 RepID=A0A4P9JLW3_9SPIT|nr:ribosomal protein S2 [Pseudourostyla cristata]